MNRAVYTNAMRFIVLFLIQVLVLERIDLGLGNFLSPDFFIYPLYIMLLPFRTPRWLLLISSFILGLGVDLFYDSPGVHASASVFTAYFREFVLGWLKPKGGYNIDFSPTRKRFGNYWFYLYSSILLLIHIFFYFGVDAFFAINIGDIVKKISLGYLYSILFIFITMYIFNPED